MHSNQLSLLASSDSLDFQRPGPARASAGDSRECRPRGTASRAQCYKLMVGTACRVLELQIIILALLENFEFSLPPQNEKTKIYRKPSHFMLPMAKGEKGAWMGLVIKSLD